MSGTNLKNFPEKDFSQFLLLTYELVTTRNLKFYDPSNCVIMTRGFKNSKKPRSKSYCYPVLKKKTEKEFFLDHSPPFISIQFKEGSKKTIKLTPHDKKSKNLPDLFSKSKC